MPFAHGLCSPGSNCPLVHRKALIRDNEVVGDAQNFSKTLAGPACPKRIIEAEKIDGGFCKCHSVQFKTIGKVLLIFSFGVNEAIALTFEKGSLHRIGQTESQVFIERINGSPVNQNFNFTCYFFGFGDGLFLPLTPRLRQGFGGIQRLFNKFYLTIHQNPRKAFTQQKV